MTEAFESTQEENEQNENAEPVIVQSEKSASTPARPPTGSQAHKDVQQEGLALIAIYHFLMSIPGLLIGFLVLTIPLPAVVMSVDDPVGLTAGLVTLGLVALGFGLSGVLYILAGIGLLKRWNWARWLAIALGMVMALFVPIGTVIGAVVIIYLLNEDVRRTFTG